MWNMLCKLISLAAALITATSAQLLTIDNNLIVQVPENETLDSEDHTDVLVDDVGTNNSYINNITNIAPTSTNRALIDSSAEEDQRETFVGEALSDTNPFSTEESSSKGTRSETLQSTEATSNEKPKSGEETSINASKDKGDNISPDQPSSSENSSQRIPPSGEDTHEKPNSKEPDSNEKLGSSEVLSVEHPNNGENPDNSSSRSGTSNIDSDFSCEGSESCLLMKDEELMVQIQTSHGPVKGHKWHDNCDIMSYIDIPYGKFNGPFDAPDTAQSWLDVHNITEHTKRCPQLNDEEYIGDTDCLTLSIFTPKDAENASVLFHVYDGYSDTKSADPSIYGPDYLVAKGIILVLPNYRLGSLGFLCMQNETAPGNAGLKDLSLALEWIKENIQLFGGDPNNIVVSGDGAAGAYAGYLAICSRSKYYINKVITESGSALSHWALDRNPISTAYKLIEKIRTNYSDGEVYNNTFDVSLETIVKAAKGIRFSPCLEHDTEPFINTTPWKMLQGKDIDTTFMIGSASYAGTREAMDITTDYPGLNENFEQFLPRDLSFNSDEERKEFAQQLKKQYFREDNITLEALSLWHTDASYLGPSIRLARPLLTAGATVYLYEFAFVGTLNRELVSMENAVPGAVRRDIVGYIFYKDETTVNDDSPEKHMINIMVDLWVSFINTGKPTAEKVTWNELKKAEDSEEEWLLIDSEPKAVKGIHVERLRLWTHLYNEHFIEHNSALRHYRPHQSLAVIAALMCWMANN